VSCVVQRLDKPRSSKINGPRACHSIARVFFRKTACRSHTHAKYTPRKRNAKSFNSSSCTAGRSIAQPPRFTPKYNTAVLRHACGTTRPKTLRGPSQLRLPQHDDTIPSAEGAEFESHQRFFDFSGVDRLPLQEFERLSEDPAVCPPKLEHEGHEAFFMSSELTAFFAMCVCVLGSCARLPWYGGFLEDIHMDCVVSCFAVHGGSPCPVTLETLRNVLPGPGPRGAQGVRGTRAWSAPSLAGDPLVRLQLQTASGSEAAKARLGILAFS